MKFKLLFVLLVSSATAQGSEMVLSTLNDTMNATLAASDAATSDGSWLDIVEENQEIIGAGITVVGMVGIVACYYSYHKKAVQRRSEQRQLSAEPSS